MTPERLDPRVRRLTEITDRNATSDVGALAFELAAYMTEQAREEPGAVAELATKVDARFVVHELAIAELYRRIGPDPADEAEATVFGIPVVLAEGVDAEKIRQHVAALERGLEPDQAVARLEERGLLRRVGNPANHTAVTVTPPRQGGQVAETDE